ncbi:MAG: helix-turn-helix domain-containing protein [Halonotius sp.]
MGDSSTGDDARVSESVLDTLGDESTRAIIEALSEPMTANELSEACDIPLSTMYRKLDRLAEADLVRESTEIRESGQHTTRYARDFTEVSVWVDDEEELVTTVERPAAEQTADQRLEELWTELRKET